MAIYSTEKYEIVSIMNEYETRNGVTTWEQGALYVQGLPEEEYRHIIRTGMLDPTLVEDDFNNLDRFMANVIPSYEQTFMATSVNVYNDERIHFSANSAISPISMTAAAAER